jgi:thioredoxin-like negative regulator of GroEL
MVSLLLTVILASVTSEQNLQQDYADAYKQSVAEKKPLMVVVGAPWCPACNVLKDSTLKPMASSGELDAVSLVMINRDEAPELAQQLTKGVRTLPQIIVFSQEETGQWKRRRLMGFQTRQPVRTLIRTALGRR